MFEHRTRRRDEVNANNALFSDRISLVTQSHSLKSIDDVGIFFSDHDRKGAQIVGSN